MEKKKHQKILNKQYRLFLDEGIINTLSEQDIAKALEGVKGLRGKHKDECRSLIILLYYTGCRPKEALQVHSRDIKRDKRHLTVKLVGSKGGRPRTIYLPLGTNKKPRALVRELMNYAMSCYPDMLIFYHFIGHYLRRVKTKKGPVITRVDTTDKLRYHFKNWFKDVVEGSISPYFLRHNRFSKLAQKGVTLEQLRLIKGSKSFDSIMEYLHMSKSEAEKISRKID